MPNAIYTPSPYVSNLSDRNQHGNLLGEELLKTVTVRSSNTWDRSISVTRGLSVVIFPLMSRVKHPQILHTISFHVLKNVPTALKLGNSVGCGDPNGEIHVEMYNESSPLYTGFWESRREHPRKTVNEMYQKYGVKLDASLNMRKSVFALLVNLCPGGPATSLDLEVLYW